MVAKSKAHYNDSTIYSRKLDALKYFYDYFLLVVCMNNKCIINEGVSEVEAMNVMKESSRLKGITSKLARGARCVIACSSGGIGGTPPSPYVEVDFGCLSSCLKERANDCEDDSGF